MQPILLLFRLARPRPQLAAVPDAPHVDAGTDRPSAGARPANGPFAVFPGMTRVTATELWNVYDANEAEAERRFAHRPVYVGGAVDRVSRAGGLYVVQLSVSGTAAASVGCRTRDGSRAVVENLRRGDLVMVAGERVFKAHGQVIVEGCTVIDDDLTAPPFAARSW